MNTQVNKAYLKNNIWVPFNMAQTILDPGDCQPVAVLTLAPGQRAKLAWLSLYYIRLLASFVPNKINPQLGSVYAGLYSSGGALIQITPGLPLAYVGLDFPSVGQLSPAFAPEIGEADTYTLMVMNNMVNVQVEASCLGSWHLKLT